MGVQTSREERLASAIQGWQRQICGKNVNVAGTLTVPDISGSAAGTPLAGQTLATGTFYYAIDVAGCSALDVTLRMSAHTGTVPTITLYPTLSDRLSMKGTATSVTSLADATQATTSVLTLRGERVWLLKVVVPAASSATFDQADYSAL